MIEKRLISPQVYIHNSDRSYYKTIRPNNSALGSGGAGGVGGGGSIKSNTNNNGGFNNNGSNQLTCTAIKYSQGYDPFVNYTYDNIIIDGAVKHSPYVECNYVL